MKNRSTSHYSNGSVNKKIRSKRVQQKILKSTKAIIGAAYYFALLFATSAVALNLDGAPTQQDFFLYLPPS